MVQSARSDGKEPDGVYNDNPCTTRAMQQDLAPVLMDPEGVLYPPTADVGAKDSVIQDHVGGTHRYDR